MKRDDVRDAAQEARRFLRLVAVWQKRIECRTANGYCPPSCAEGGAMRRASMDLTRALAKMRRTGT